MPYYEFWDFFYVCCVERESMTVIMMNLWDVDGGFVVWPACFPRGTRKIHEKHHLEEPMP
jgi:hypothetical protein